MNYMKEKSIEQIKEELKKLEKMAAHSGHYSWFVKIIGKRGKNGIRKTT